MGRLTMNPKSHHYVPVTYLRYFTDDKGKVQVYLKDDPDKKICLSPRNVGFHKYYYSQPLPDGTMNHDKLESVFSQIEGKWPSIVDRLTNGGEINEALEDLLTFIALQRVRVPANRDAVEKMLSDTVLATARLMHRQGKLPPLPKGCEDLLDHIKVSIDPHKSIVAMAQMFPVTFKIFDSIGIGALHNKTDVPFLTSDNPVIWFDPSVTEQEARPYMLEPGGPILFLFPVTPDLIIYGDTSMKEQFDQDGFGDGDLADKRYVTMINREICKYAYEAIYAQRPGQETLIRQCAKKSPVVKAVIAPFENEQLIYHRFEFGRREKKTKWK